MWGFWAPFQQGIVEHLERGDWLGAGSQPQTENLGEQHQQVQGQTCGPVNCILKSVVPHGMCHMLGRAEGLESFILGETGPRRVAAVLWTGLV